MTDYILLVLAYIILYAQPVAVVVFVCWLVWKMVRAILARLGLVKPLPARERITWRAADADEDEFDMRALPRAPWRPRRSAIRDSSWMFRDK